LLNGSILILGFDLAATVLLVQVVSMGLDETQILGVVLRQDFVVVDLLAGFLLVLVFHLAIVFGMNLLSLEPGGSLL
jgi:hypothetical protein